MKVVFDTSVLVAALAFPGGRADDALRALFRSGGTLCLSPHLLDEVLRTLARKFDRDREEIARAAVFLAEAGEIVRPKGAPGILPDPNDDRILACAIAAEAAALVTGDKAMLRVGAVGPCRIVSLRAFLESVG